MTVSMLATSHDREGFGVVPGGANGEGRASTPRRADPHMKVSRSDMIGVRSILKLRMISI